MRRVLFSAAVLGVVITISTAAGTVVATKSIDDHREDLSARRGEEMAWRQAVFGGTSFPGAQLAGLDLHGLFASGVDFSGADAERVVLASATLTGSRFDGAKLVNADLSGAQLYHAGFAGADLTGIDLRRSQLVEVDLRSATLVDADLTDAFLLDVDLRGVDLAGAHLPDSARRGMCWDQSTRWPDGFTPVDSYCLDRVDRQEPAAAEQGLVTAKAQAAATEFQWRKALGMGGPSDFKVLVGFSNIGKVILKDVTILLDVEPKGVVSAVPGSVKWVDGNFPDGVHFDDAAIQGDDHSQVNIGTGDYLPNGGGWLVVTYTVDDPRRCDAGGVTVTAYATPTLRGTASDSASVSWSVPPC